MIGQQVTGKQGHRFVIIHEIGRGGFGIVYLANDESGHPCALKLIAPVGDPEIRLSFEQEIHSSVGLSHENILRIIDYGACVVGTQHGLFTVTEYCPDGDYRQLLTSRRAGSPQMDEVLGDFLQILSGLGALHSRIIHRDLKPENVMVAAGRLKIGDFGLAKFVDAATRTLTFKGAGTPLYMAPEVWQNGRATQATDLYAVGIMLFEALTGRPPFTSQDVSALRDQHLYAPAPRVKSFDANIPDLLDGIVKKLLSKEPTARYQRAGDVLQALGTSTPATGPEVEELAARIRRLHDAEEVERLEQERMAESEQDSVARNKYKEKEVMALIDEVVAEINAHLAETRIQMRSTRAVREYCFGNRALVVRFFGQGELFRDPEVPGRMEILTKHHAVHGGYIEIKERGQDREGWNLVLVRPPDSMYGQWRIVETRVSPLTGRGTQYEPIATEARLFADNLACHWWPAVHVYVLKDKALERSDILKIFEVFIPKS